MKQALIIIDVQNDYFEGGKMPLHNPLKALENIEYVLTKFREKGLPVIHIQHICEPDDDFFQPNTNGAEIHSRLTPLCNEYHFIKHMPSSFLGTGLEKLLKEEKISDVVVCGMMSHMCVDTTVRACQDFGLNVILLDDACATMDLDYNGEVISAETVHKTYMASLDGVFAKIIKTDELVLVN